MSAQTIFQSEYMSVYCDPEKKQVSHVIHKPLDGKQLREGLMAGIEAMRTHGATKWFSDDRLSGEVDTSDREWAFNEFLRLAMEAGWKFWAIVVPHEIAGRASMVALVSDYAEKGVKTRVFTSVPEAQAWLDTL